MLGARFSPEEEKALKERAEAEGTTQDALIHGYVVDGLGMREAA